MRQCRASLAGMLEAPVRVRPSVSVMAVIVQAADSASGARPGARREAFESYVKRLTRLEEIGPSPAG